MATVSQMDAISQRERCTTPTAMAIRTSCIYGGDMNCDGVVNNFDVNPFALVLVDPSEPFATYRAAWPACNPGMPI